MSQLAVVFDGDGVLIDSHPVVVEETNKKYDTTFTVSDMKEYNILPRAVYNILKSRNPATKETEKAITAWMFGDENMSKALPTPGSQKLVTNLANVGFTVCLGTSRPVSQADLTREWLQKYFPEIKSLTIGGDKYDRLKAKYKAVIDNDALAFFDDDGRVIMDIYTSGALKPTVLGLIDKPWNQQYTLIKRKGTRALRYGFWQENNYEWGKIFDILCMLI